MSNILHILLVAQTPQQEEQVVQVLTKADFLPYCRHISQLYQLRAALVEKSWDLLIMADLRTNSGQDELTLAATMHLVQRHQMALPVVMVVDQLDLASARETIRIGVQDLLSQHDLQRLALIVERERYASQSRRQQQVDEALSRRIEKQSYRSQRLESLSMLAGGIAHNFNNILATMLGYTELALDYDPRHSANITIKYLHEVFNAGLMARNMVGQLLLFSRSSPQKRRTVVLDEMVEDVVELYRRRLAEGVTLRHHLAMKNVYVLADPTLMQQVLLNLLDNASQAVGVTGGEINVALDSLLLSADDARVRQLQPGCFACLSVHDSGAGMEESICERIFDPFFTTKEVDEGHGLGLSVAHGIIVECGGTIEVSSQLGKGSLFRVFLPVTTLSSCMEQDFSGEVS
ncbi:MAG: hypothetical protein HQL60_07090 [Magnetococcales bacterium]|nr:hypothetical protein [Magnetococcales bacterium]